MKIPDLNSRGAAKAKIYVVQANWSMLVQTRTLDTEWDFMMISGSMAPALRNADSTRGEAVAGVLSSCPKIVTGRVRQIFPSVHRIVECDEAKSNERGTRLYAAAQAECGNTSLHLFCSAHKIHAICDKHGHWTDWCCHR